jgi:mRNA-degrading endonuclease HigB of HigAB toxin-antitoxin module
MPHVIAQKNSLVNNFRRIINILNVKREKSRFIAHVNFKERQIIMTAIKMLQNF